MIFGSGAKTHHKLSALPLSVSGTPLRFLRTDLETILQKIYLFSFLVMSTVLMFALKKGGYHP